MAIFLIKNFMSEKLLLEHYQHIDLNSRFHKKAVHLTNGMLVIN